MGLGGAEFVIEFPIGDCRLVNVPAVTSSTGCVGLRVLVLDDEEAIRRSVSTLLRGLGHEAVAASHIASARSNARDAVDAGRAFDVAIIDLTLGSESGVDAVAELRQISPDTRFVVSSGYSNASVMADFGAYGFDGVLPKPYTARELREQLQPTTGERVVG